MSKKLTPEKRERLNKVYFMLKSGTTRDDIRRELNVSDRAAQDLVSIVAHKYPVVSLSDRKGHLLLSPKPELTKEQAAEYMELCRHAKAENSRRAAEILKRNDPLTEWENS